MLKKIKHFLLDSNTNDFSKLLVLVLFFLGAASLLALFFVEPHYILFADIAILGALIASHFLDFFFYVMVFFYPFIGWEMRLENINIPYVDLLAILVFSGWLVKKIVNWTKHNKLKLQDFPGLAFALFFLIVAAISITNNSDLLLGIKYWLRPLVFFYFMFIVLPYNLIDSKEKLFRVLRILLVVGVLVMFLGLLSVITADGSWFDHRAVPYNLGNFAPLGGNHNAIAEVLIVTIPIILILLLIETKIKYKNWYLIILYALVFTLILTYSRSGWLALLIQFLIILGVRFRKKWGRQLTGFIVVALVIIPILFYFSFFQELGFVQMSNTNRILATEVSLHNFLQHPIIGNGLNTFQNLLGSTFVYFVEFGDPLDSHGFVQKLLVETGLLGLLGYVSILGYCFVRFLKRFVQLSGQEKEVMLMFLMIFMAMVVFQLFSTSYFIARMWLPIGIGLAAVRIFSHEPKLVD